MDTAYISLGGNLGREKELFAAALSMLEQEGVHILQCSSLYRTEPQGQADQPWYRNQVAAIGWSGTPISLLHRMQAVENSLGRIRTEGQRFGPRAIDLDLLLFQDIVMHNKELILPHPRMRERAFVLVPLLAIAPDIRLPDGTLARDALAALAYRQDNDAIYQGV